jgi:RimJ/RimL family protein N-acetyltransferase
VEFKTDARNERSRGALTALGAELEGIFRKHRIVPGVGQRDSAYFSVIDDDWPAVRANLEERLAVHA